MTATTCNLSQRFPHRRVFITGAASGLGLAVDGAFVETPEADWRWLFDLNVHGIANSRRSVVPVMQAQRSGGVIINVASAASFVTNAQLSA
jgi:NADP-dependent 3-hydroxy acid dehydrogenase YdfG